MFQILPEFHFVWKNLLSTKLCVSTSDFLISIYYDQAIDPIEYDICKTLPPTIT